VCTPSSPLKKLEQHKRQRRRHLAEAETDHGESHPGSSGGNVANQYAQNQSGQPAETRYKNQRSGKIRVRMEVVDQMNGEIAGHPEIDGMAERKHAPLTEEHIVGAGEYDENADLTQHGQ